MIEFKTLKWKLNRVRHANIECRHPVQGNDLGLLA